MSASNDHGETRDFHVLRRMDELRAIADQARIDMLRLLTREPMTGSMIARSLGIPANRAHYHVRRLVDSKLVRPVGSATREGEWKGERYFVATARHFIVDPQLACQDPETAAVLHQSIEAAFFDWRRAQLAVDWTPLAKKLVTETLRVAPDEHILVAFLPTVLDFAESIVVEIEGAGGVAHPKPWSRNVITRTLDRYEADELDRVRFVPEAIDRDLSAVVLVTCSLTHGSPPTATQRERMPHLLQSVSKWHQSVRERRLRHVEVALPHRGEFARGTMSAEASIDTYWRCVEADPVELHDRGERLRARASGNPDIRIWGSNGTDLRVKVVPEQTHVSDGVISEDDVRRGRCSEFLPTGGVSLLPALNSGDGIVHADYTLSQGKFFHDVVIEVRDGRIIQVDAAEDADILRAQIEEAAGESDMISGIAVGTNARAEGSTGKPTLDSHLEGVVTVAFGNNELAGGKVSSTLSLSFPTWRLSMNAGTEPLVREGRLVTDTRR